MKRRLIRILFVLVLCLSIAVPALADAPLVSDNSGLLTAQEITQLEQQYARIREEKGFTPYIMTTDTFDGYSSDRYSDLMYDTMGCDYDGMLLVVNLVDGYWSIHVKGVCDKTLTNDQIDYIGEKVADHLRDGDYYEAFKVYGEECVTQMSPVAYVAQELTFGRVLIALIIGVVGALIVLGIMMNGMKTVKANNTANYYARPGSMKVTNSRDIFLYSNVTRVRKQSSSSGGGGGGGGRSRGSGGGRSRSGRI